MLNSYQASGYVDSQMIERSVYLSYTMLQHHCIYTAIYTFTRERNYVAVFYEHRLINSLRVIFDSLPCLDTSSPRIDFPNSRSTLVSLSIIRSVTPKSSTTSIAKPRTLQLLRFDTRLCLVTMLPRPVWAESTKIINVIVCATRNDNTFVDQNTVVAHALHLRWAWSAKAKREILKK